MLWRSFFCLLAGIGCSLPVVAHQITLTAAGLSTTSNTEFEYKTSATQSRQSASTNALSGEFAVGYVWNVNADADLGFEFFYDLSGPQVNENSGFGGYVSDTVQYVYGFRFLPGFNITHSTQIYLDLGYAAIGHELDLHDANAPGFSTLSKTGSSWGFRYGAGVEAKVYQQLALRVSYAVMDGGEVKINNDNGTASYASTPTVYDFMFGATYHFQI